MATSWGEAQVLRLCPRAIKWADSADAAGRVFLGKASPVRTPSIGEASRVHALRRHRRDALRR
ncbi:MAG: hypothetical protein PF480_10735 [Roseovarius sp.]|nr:hypothetical protein [Roseovarius sp.]